ncbi:MAG: hypothetical protein ACRDD1_05000 [Planctomycetia bacterium]
MAVSIEFLHELVDRLTTAAAANLSTPKRKGSVVHLTPADGQEVFVAGDLHGNRSNYNKILRAVDLSHHLRRHLVLQEVVHGGPSYAEGGCMSHLLLEEMAALKVKHPDRFHFLLCNHELSEATNVAITKAGVSQNLKFAQGLEIAYGPAAKRIAQLFHEFIRSCPLAVKTSDGVFISHSLPDSRVAPNFDDTVFDRTPTERDLTSGGPAHAVVWGRDYTPEHAQHFASMLGVQAFVQGHEPTPTGWRRPNDRQIVLDASGPLCYLCRVPIGAAPTALDLEKQLQRL